MERTANDDAVSRLARLTGFVARDPANPLLLADALGLAIDLGRHDEADRLAALAEPLLASHPDRAAFIAAPLCLHHLLHGRHADALRCGRLAVAGGKASATSVANTAWAAWYCREFAETRDLLVRAFPQAATSPPDVNRLLARALHHLGEIDAAIARLSAGPGPQAAGPDAETLGLRSLLRSDNDDLDGAIAEARACLAQVPGQPDALLALGESLKALDRLDEAADAFGRLCLQDPRSGRGWSGLAQVHLARLELEKAKQCALEAVRHMPDHLGTWHVLGWTHVLAGDAAAAREAFAASLPLERGFADTHGGLAVADAMEGRRGEAERNIRIAERLDPDAVAVQYARLLLLAQAQDADGMRALVERTLARQAPGSTGNVHGLVERRLREMMAAAHTLH